MECWSIAKRNAGGKFVEPGESQLAATVDYIGRLARSYSNLFIPSADSGRLLGCLRTNVAGDIALAVEVSSPWLSSPLRCRLR